MTKSKWMNISPPLHILILICSVIAAISAGFAWAGSVSPTERIATLETKQQVMADNITDIKTGQARIEQKVDSLADWMKASRR